jgi:hypothetical protein
MKPWALLLVIASACDINTNVPASPSPPLFGPWTDSSSTPGVNGEVDFLFDFGESIDRAIAAGGASTGIYAIARSTAPEIGSVVSSDPTVLAVTADTGDATRRTLTVVSGAPGSADLVVLDVSGAEIDRLAIEVAPSVALALDCDCDTTSVTILAGAVQMFHVTTMGPDDVLVGTGAVAFTLDPAFVPSTASAAPFWLAYGDEVFFQAPAPGTGTVTAHAPDASVALAITAVDASAIDTITLAQAEGDPDGSGAWIEASASTGATPVYGALCSWSAPSGVTVTLEGATGGSADPPSVFQGGGLGGDPAIGYQVNGNPGTYPVTCTMPGGPSSTVNVTIGS